MAMSFDGSNGAKGRANGRDAEGLQAQVVSMSLELSALREALEALGFAPHKVAEGRAAPGGSFLNRVALCGSRVEFDAWQVRQAQPSLSPAEVAEAQLWFTAMRATPDVRACAALGWRGFERRRG